jgi:transcriptional regulator with XRE-family HTH domain
MKNCRSTFTFTPELGAKLRALRRQRNLTMCQLAALMGGDSRGAFNHLTKLPPKPSAASH